MLIFSIMDAFPSRLFARLSVMPFAAMLIFACDKDDPKVTEVRSEITSISPVAGEAGTIVKIRGKNLDVTPAIVTFRGVEAEVLSVSDSVLEVEAPQGSGTGAVSIVVDSKTILGPEFKFYHIYVYGSNNNSAVYWRDGEMVTIQERGFVTGIAVEGNDIHAIGESTNAGFVPAYWKNKVLSPLEATDYRTVLTGIAVSGNDVHICGITTTNAPTGWIAKYWKNGMLMFESPADGKGTAFYDIAVDGNDVYISGIIAPDAVLWKNGVPTILTSGPQLSIARKIRIVGSDVHVIGVDGNGWGSANKMRYWKNGANVELANDTRFSPIDFVLNEGEPLMVGYGYPSDLFYSERVAKQYYKGTFTQLSEVLEDYGSAIEMTEGGTYILTNSNDYYRNYFDFEVRPYGGILKKNGIDITPEYSEGFTGYAGGFVLVPY